jgi:hypothetical protein
MRWRPILCFWGLILFGTLIYGSIRVNRDMRHNHYSRYFWWGAVRLDSDPLNRHSRVEPCEWKQEGDCGWDPGYIWVTPGLIQRALVLSALPAFLAAIAVVRVLARLGISELVSFMFTMPVLILAWFYTVGWLLDRWRYRRSLRQASATS